MFAQAEEFQKVLVALSVLRYIVGSNCKKQKTDIAVEAEDFFCTLLNIVLGAELKNLNHERPNHPAIDLGCDLQRLAIQVTATNDSSKIKDTLQSFFKEKFEKKYDKLIVLILTSKLDYRSDFNQESEGLKKFEIWDIDDLLTFIERTQIEIDFKQITALIRQELPGIIRVLSPPDSLLSRMNALEGIPAATANAFLHFVRANLDEAPAIKADIDQLFDTLQRTTYPTMREYLVALLHNAKENWQFGLEWWNCSYWIGRDVLIVDPRRIGLLYHVTENERRELLADLMATNLLRPIEGHPDYWMPHFSSPGLDGNLLSHLRNYARNDLVTLRIMLAIPDFSPLDAA